MQTNSRRNYWKHGMVICVMLFSLVYTANAQKFGDNLGNHIAVKPLDMNNKSVVNAAGVYIGFQVAIDSANIALQIESSNKALRISRVADTSSIAVAYTGMLIYSQKDDTFYGRQNGKWVAFGSFSGGVTTINGQFGNFVIQGNAGTGKEMAKVSVEISLC